MTQDAYHILIFDKTSADLDRLIGLLKDNACQVTFIDNAQEAYQFCLSNHPDLIIFDVHTDGLDGLNFYRQVKNQYSTHRIPILLVTAEKTYKKRIDLMDMGVEDFVTKPYYPEEVAARVLNIFQEFKPVRSMAQSVDRGFVGNLKEMNLIDLIQTMELGKKSGIINLNRGDKEGQIYVNKGKIVDAVVEDYDNVQRAYLHLLTWIEGSFYVIFQDIDLDNPLTDDTQTLFSEGIKVIDQWRKEIGELPSLHTRLIAVNEENNQTLSYPERTMIANFQKPVTIVQAIDHSDFDDFDGLKVIKSLLEKGLLIKPENHQPDEDHKSLPFRPARNSQYRDAKSKYSHIFSIFQRSKKTDKNFNLHETAEKTSETPDLVLSSHSRIKNKIQLTKAELLLIRQKLGN